MGFTNTGQPMTESGMKAALAIMEMDPAADMPLLWSVLTVESRGFGFLADRRPKILFERHIFYQETAGRFAAEAPDICARSGGGYSGGAVEYDRLGRALALCRRDNLGDDPALRSASWGLGQVMGFNAVDAGFSSAADMIERMAASEDAQLAGMAGFIASEKLDAKLRNRDWAGFARRYNGTNYWRNEYDMKLKSAFEKFSAGVMRDLCARTAQGALLYLGFSPGDPDGVVGQNTRKAIAAFRKANNLGTGGELTRRSITKSWSRQSSREAILLRVTGRKKPEASGSSTHRAAPGQYLGPGQAVKPTESVSSAGPGDLAETIMLTAPCQ